MNFFFYLVVLLLLFLLPIFVRAEGSFYSDRNYLFVRIFLFGIRILTVRLYLREGIYLSINNKVAKEIKLETGKKTTKPFNLDWLNAIRSTKADLTVYAGGDPTALSLGIVSIMLILNSVFSARKASGGLDRYKLNVMPCYNSQRTTVNFSIELYTSIALFLSALTHTTKGERNAKRSNREYNG